MYVPLSVTSCHDDTPISTVALRMPLVLNDVMSDDTPISRCRYVVCAAPVLATAARRPWPLQRCPRPDGELAFSSR